MSEPEPLSAAEVAALRDDILAWAGGIVGPRILATLDAERATRNPEEIDVERLEAAQNKHYENMAYRLHVCVGGCAADIAREYASESHPTKEPTDG